MLLCALLTLVVHHSSRAKLQPYFVLSNSGDSKVRPRILFVVDTSDTMSIRTDVSVTCEWNWMGCETEGHFAESRMSVARRVMKSAIERFSGIGDFSLMTFSQFTPAKVVPPKCGHSGGPKRFVWINERRLYANDGSSYSTRPIDHLGYVGIWAICAGRDPALPPHVNPITYPYPYLRWDNLGVGSVISADDQTGSIPPSPLISTAQANYTNGANAVRKVQWFPRFMGVRINLNDTSDPGETVLRQTIGDYGSTVLALQANVKNQDFYFWPYVEGFPGYALGAGVGDPAYVDDNWRTGQAGGNRWYRGQLWTPFFLRDADLNGTVPPGNWGPRTRAEINQDLLWQTSPLVEGGIDPSSQGGTPWASTIGDVPAVPVMDNNRFSQTTVAGYLKFVETVDSATLCTPSVVVVLTDGVPWPAAEGGPLLNQRLADLRRVLGAKTYVVGLFGGIGVNELNDMACAAAGACDGASCSTPCDDVPFDNWDTCQNPADPANACGFMANTKDELEDALYDIIIGNQTRSIATGATASVSQLGGFGGDDGLAPGERLQTTLRAHTEWPGWEGHVAREACPPGDPWCVVPSTPPNVYPFGGCPAGWEWDAGECLKLRNPRSRKIYTHDAAGKLVLVYNKSGSIGDGIAGAATTRFRDVADSLGLLPSGVNKDVSATLFARYIQGYNRPNNWKLPGVANASPVVVRRIPAPDTSSTPQIPMADPHCSGRVLAASAADTLPQSLIDFAETANTKTKPAPQVHLEYQEAVLVGDDLGVIHGFQLQSGNELWGYIPRFLLPSAHAQYENGEEDQGQPDSLDDHIYGVASTATHGIVWDAGANKWRHLAVIGFGAGSHEYVALDVSHMSPQANRSADRPSCSLLGSGGCPIELVWSTDDPAISASWDAFNAETWARPALGFVLANDALSDLPEPKLILGGGYKSGAFPAGDPRGQTLIRANAVTGVIEETATAAAPGKRFESDFGFLAGVSIGSHCESRFWPEMDEVYVADPAGYLFRWDNGHMDDGLPSDDSKKNWHFAGGPNGTAKPLGTFLACVSTGQNCAVLQGGTAGWMRDTFLFSPAVSAPDRIDSLDGQAAGQDPLNPEQYLIALASGAPSDDSIDGLDAANTFHSSLYLLVDDHSVARRGGLTVPSGQPKNSLLNLGAWPHYMRLAVSDLSRTRVFRPFPSSKQYTEARRFWKGARPTRSPRIMVRGVRNLAGDLLPDVEVFEVTYTIYEPAMPGCDSRFYEPATNTWHPDLGSTYEIMLRLTVDSSTGFDFSVGSTDPNANFTIPRKLSLVSVKQITGGDCADGVCDPHGGYTGTAPCEVTASVKEPPSAVRGQPLTTFGVSGFTPTEN